MCYNREKWLELQKTTKPLSGARRTLRRMQKEILRRPLAESPSQHNTPIIEKNTHLCICGFGICLDGCVRSDSYVRMGKMKPLDRNTPWKPTHKSPTIGKARPTFQCEIDVTYVSSCVIPWFSSAEGVSVGLVTYCLLIVRSDVADATEGLRKYRQSRAARELNCAER